jgi:hypothetical protein
MGSISNESTGPVGCAEFDLSVSNIKKSSPVEEAASTKEKVSKDPVSHAIGLGVESIVAIVARSEKSVF